jgi:hypothetical protein
MLLLLRIESLVKSYGTAYNSLVLKLVSEVNNMMSWRGFLYSLSLAVVAIAIITSVSRAFQREFGQLDRQGTAIPTTAGVIKQPLLISGTAEPGNRVTIYQAIGTAVVDESGRFEYEWKGERGDDRNVVAIPDGSDQTVSTLRVFSEKTNPSFRSSEETELSDVTYTSIATDGDIQELSIIGLNQVCSLYSTTDSLDIQPLDYWGISQNRNIAGVITLADCGDSQKDEFEGVFEGEDGCSGNVKFVVTPGHRDDLGGIEQATIAWQPTSCTQAENISIVVVRR